jgi:hypothetical protein
MAVMLKAFAAPAHEALASDLKDSASFCAVLFTTD